MHLLYSCNDQNSTLLVLFAGGPIGIGGVGAGGGCGVGVGLGWGYGAAWGSKYIIIEPEFDTGSKDKRPKWLAQLQDTLRIKKWEKTQRDQRPQQQ